MERKWYLDLWALIREPFKRGIPEIVEFGTTQRGFACAIGMVAISLAISWIIEAGVSLALGASALHLGVLLGGYGWGRYFYTSLLCVNNICCVSYLFSFIQPNS